MSFIELWLCFMVVVLTICSIVQARSIEKLSGAVKELSEVLLNVQGTISSEANDAAGAPF